MNSLLTLKQLASKPHIRISDSTSSLDILKSILKALPFSPHEVCDNQGCRPRDPLATMDEHPPILLPNILKIIKHIIKDTGYVLRWAVLQPKGLVNKITPEILRTNKPHAIENMSYPILPQNPSIFGHEFTS